MYQVSGIRNVNNNIFHAANFYIILNPAVERCGVCGFWGAGQDTTTQNDATAKGGAVPSEGRCDPGIPYATFRGAPFQGVANNTISAAKILQPAS